MGSSAGSHQVMYESTRPGHPMFPVLVKHVQGSIIPCARAGLVVGQSESNCRKAVAECLGE
jgi:hypothetical protein